MKKRRILMRVDGRVLAGTATEIIGDMKMLAFRPPGDTLREYMLWLADQIVSVTEDKPLALPEGDDAVLAEFLVDTIIYRGLALETFSGK